MKQRLAFAQELAEQMKAVRHDDVSDAERNAFTATLSAARNAFQKQWYWRARTALSAAPMMHAYVKLGVMPAGQVVTRFPDKLEGKPARFYVFGEPFFKAEELQKMVSSAAPLELVDSASINPEWGGDKVLKCGGGSFSFDIDVPADGGYLLSIGHVSNKPGVTTVSINGANLAPPMVTRQPNAPEQSAFPCVTLKAGKARISLRRNASFGIYAIKWTPVLRPIPSRDWLVAGPFDGFWGNGTGRLGMIDAAVKKGFETCYPPERNQGLDAIYTTSGGRRIQWESDSDLPR